MTPSEALDYIERESIKVIETESLTLKANLVTAAPVDTGAFKRSWSIKKLNPLHFQISNRMNYADVLWGGWSKQWPAGGTPLLERANNAMHRRFKGIKA